MVEKRTDSLAKGENSHTQFLLQLRIAQWLEHPRSNQKGLGLDPRRGSAMFFVGSAVSSPFFFVNARKSTLIIHLGQKLFFYHKIERAPWSC